MSSSITFYKNQSEIDVFLPFGKNLGAVEAFATELGAYTSAAIVEVSYTQGAQLNIAEKTTDSFPFRTYAKVLIRRKSDAKLYGIVIYAPVKSMFVLVSAEDKSGYRVKQDVGETLASLYSAMAGEVFEFHKGWLQGQTYGEG